MFRLNQPQHKFAYYETFHSLATFTELVVVTGHLKPLARPDFTQIVAAVTARRRLHDIERYLVSLYLQY